MASSTPTFASLGFEPLSSLVHYSSGAGRRRQTDDNASILGGGPTEPDGSKYDLVMIWGWMDGSPRHLVKYIQLHRSLQPGVPIVLIQSTAAAWIGLTGELRASLPLVYDIVKTLSETPKIFVHAFSNGGTGAFGRLLALYRYEVGSPMPIAAMLIDSAPGGTKLLDGLHRGVLAFTSQIRNPIIKGILSPILFVILFIMYGIPSLLGFEDPISVTRRTLNDETLVSGDGIRGYTYCKGDVMVSWADIEEHADEASERGWTVLRKGFEGGSHVGGYRQEPSEYEAFVRQLRKGDKATSSKL